MSGRLHGRHIVSSGVRGHPGAGYRDGRAEQVQIARHPQQRLRRLVDVVAADALQELPVRLARVLEDEGVEAEARVVD